MSDQTPPEDRDDFVAVNNLYGNLQHTAERSWSRFLTTPAGKRLAEEPEEAEFARRGFLLGYITSVMGMTANLFQHRLEVALMPYQFIKWRLTDAFEGEPETVTKKTDLAVVLRDGSLVTSVTAEKQMKHGEGGYDCLYRTASGDYLSDVMGWCLHKDVCATFTIRADLHKLAQEQPAPAEKSES